MKRKSHRLLWIVGIIAVCSVCGVFAYWTQVLIVHNEFKTASYDTCLEEEFVSPKNWLPGQEVDKDVWVVNRGTVPTFVKIELQQAWIERENKKNLPLCFQTENGEEYASQIIWGENVVGLTSDEPEQIGVKIPLVKSIKEAEGKWLLVDGRQDETIVLYYIGVLEPEEKTPLVVDAVTMNPEIQAKVLKKVTYYDESEGAWLTREGCNTTYDYENANYTLIVNAWTVQATESAIRNNFCTEKDCTEIVDYLASQASEQEIKNAKTLLFAEEDGTMTWDMPSEDISNENWFMSFTNLVPGEKNTDYLRVENKSKKTHKLYVQATSKNQTAKQEELLEAISMKVFMNDQVIYEGTASGKSYEKISLQDLVYLGEYQPGEEAQIRVQLELEKDAGVEYCDILSENDWKFVATEENSTEPPQTIHAPKTGDSNGYQLYVIAVILSLAVMGLYGRKRSR